MSRAASSLLLLVVWFSLCVPRACPAQPPPHHPTPDEVELAGPFWEPFLAFRPGSAPYDGLPWRDLEFHWDALNDASLGDSLETTLLRFGFALSRNGGPATNALGYDTSRLELLYNYMRVDGYGSDYNRYNLYDTTSVVFGGRRTVGPLLSTYNPSDRSHVDTYVLHSSRPVATSLTAGGSIPSEYVNADEDLSTGHDSGDVLNGNSLEVRGPVNAQRMDLSGTGWTRGDGAIAGCWAHEFGHGVPGGVTGGYQDEQWGSVGQALMGFSDTTTTCEFPYTWSLCVPNQNWWRSNLLHPVRQSGYNYYGRDAFAAYLASNFMGEDTSLTLAGMQDDLLHKWKSRPGATFKTLRGLLGDSCVDCARLLDTSSTTLSDTARLALLHHYWRAANYVNNPALAGGQYGYPTWYGFSPGRHLGAWRDVDGIPNYDIVNIPPEVTMTPAHLTRQMQLVGTRALGDSTYPLVLQIYGSEYWVVRSDPELTGGGQDLVIRVWSDSVGRRTISTGIYCESPFPWVPSGFPTTMDGRLVASVVGYSGQTDASGNPVELWQRPGWAVSKVNPRWTDTDSLGDILELVVPDFGGSVKAAFLVLTMADGPHQYFTDRGVAKQDSLDLPDNHDNFPYNEVLPYRVSLALRKAPLQSADRVPIAITTTLRESDPTWSPGGEWLCYTATAADGTTQLRGVDSDGGPSLALIQGSGFGRQCMPDWSPRGDRVAFCGTSASGLDEVHVCTPWTSTDVQLTTRGLGAASWPKFSPNGQQIAYIEHLAGAGGGLTGPWQVRRVNLNGTGDTALVVRQAQVELTNPRWAPDGQRIYFLAGDSLYAVGVSTGSFGQVESQAAMAPHAARFDFSPGSGDIVFEEDWAATYHVECPVVHREPMPFRRIALRDTTMGLTTPLFYRTGAEYFGPRWSPDGTRVAYSTSENDSSGRDVYVALASYNHAPVFVSAPRDTLIASVCGRGLWQTFAAVDADSEAVRFEAVYLPPGASLDTLGNFAWPTPPFGTEHYTVIRAVDPSGGCAQKVVRFATAADSIAPDSTSDLERMMGRESALLSWTEAGDNGASGTACRIRIRYGTYPITEDNFFQANGDTIADLGAPQGAGAVRCVVVDDLASCTWYYFGLKTQDDAGRWSPLSTVIGKTTCSGSAAPMCYGEDLMAQVGGEGLQLEGAVLEQATTGTTSLGLTPIQRVLRQASGDVRVRLSTGNSAWSVDAAGLWAVDRDADEQSFLHGDRVLVGALSAAARVSDGTDDDFAAKLMSGGEVAVASAGTQWEVDLGGAASQEAWLFIEAGGGDSHSAEADSGITILRQDRSGQWVATGSVAPGRRFTPMVVDSVRGGEFRLVFNREYQVRRLGRVEVTDRATILNLELAAAEHSRLGSAKSALSGVGGGESVLRPHDKVDLSFKTPTVASGKVRDFYLVMRGRRATRAEYTAAQPRLTETERLPVAFALRQSEPNPFRHTSRIGFDLPQPSSVRLEIFDLQGRRIAQLADGSFSAGYHRVEWDGRASDGRRVQAGVYVYRLQAGSFRAQRKMVLVQ